MARIAVILLVVGILFLAVWMLLPKASVPTCNTSQTQSGQPAISQIPDSIEVPINTQNNSGELGHALITKKDDKIIVHIDVKGEPEGVSQPAHIHLGACPNPGAVKYPLTNVVKGSSDTTVNIAFNDLKKALPLAINVHKSEVDSKTYVACGDVKI